LSNPTDDIRSIREFREEVEPHYPHCIKLVAGKFPNRVALEVLEFAGPARYHIQLLRSIGFILVKDVQDNPAYSTNGSWFHISSNFYFKHHADAVLFKLRFQ